jgi:hypothetical protein
MRHDGRSRQWNERDDHPQREQQHAVGLNGRNRRWSVCKPDGGVSLKDARLARDAARLRVKGDRSTPGVDIVQEKRAARCFSECVPQSLLVSRT